MQLFARGESLESRQTCEWLSTAHKSTERYKHLSKVLPAGAASGPRSVSLRGGQMLRGISLDLARPTS